MKYYIILPDCVIRKPFTQFFYLYSTTLVSSTNLEIGIIDSIYSVDICNIRIEKYSKLFQVIYFSFSYFLDGNCYKIQQNF